jgi:heptosyltransferase-2
LTLEKANRILIIRFSALGDILLTTPFLRVIKKQYPYLKIDFLVKTNFIDAIKLNPNLARVISWGNENEFTDLLNDIKKYSYDFVIDLQNNFRSRKIVRKIGVQKTSYVKPNLKKFLLVQLKINLLKEKKSIPQRYLESVPELELDKKGLELFLPENVNPKVELGNKTIGFAPGAFHFTKSWPLKYYAELGKLLTSKDFQIAIFGGKSDIEICRELQSEIPNSINLSNENNLFQTAVDMKKCKVIVCNDSGLMHTATAVGVPVVSIFGSTVREFGFAPFGVENLVIEKSNLSCRPCTHIGRAECSKNHFKCMLELTPQSVFVKVQKFMSKI